MYVSIMRICIYIYIWSLCKYFFFHVYTYIHIIISIYIYIHSIDILTSLSCPKIISHRKTASWSVRSTVHPWSWERGCCPRRPGSDSPAARFCYLLAPKKKKKRYYQLGTKPLLRIFHDWINLRVWEFVRQLYHLEFGEFMVIRWECTLKLFNIAIQAIANCLFTVDIKNCEFSYWCEITRRYHMIHTSEIALTNHEYREEEQWCCYNFPKSTAHQFQDIYW